MECRTRNIEKGGLPMTVEERFFWAFVVIVIAGCILSFVVIKLVTLAINGGWI